MILRGGLAESEYCKGFAHYARSEDDFSITDTMNREVGEGANSGDTEQSMDMFSSFVSDRVS